MTDLRLLDVPAKGNNCWKAGVSQNVKGIMWHSTAANNPYLRRYVQPCLGDPHYADLIAALGKNRYGNDWCNNALPGGKAVCVHAFIGLLADGSVATAQIMPFGVRAWHCGGSANTGYVSFEMCEDDGADADYMEAVYQQAVAFSAYICRCYSLDPMKDGVILSHNEGGKRGIASKHTDPDNWWKGRYTMDRARRDIAAALKTEEEINVEERYNTLTEIERDAPWAAPTVDKLIRRQALLGDGTGLDLSRDMLRILVIHDRMGLYGS